MLSQEEIARYARHLVMPEVGIEGQRRLKRLERAARRRGGPRLPGRALPRRGGRGTHRHRGLRRRRREQPAAADPPRHELGRAAQARERAARGSPPSTPTSRVETHAAALTRDNALEILAGYDVVVDGTDNFETRYLTNDACYFLKKPNVYGSIFRFEGQASVFWPDRGPCYRCLFPQPPPPGLVPSCAEGGVLGVLPGVIGGIQATEAIKILLGVGRAAGGPPAPLRRPRHALRRGEAPARSRVPALLAEGHDPRAAGLPGLLRDRAGAEDAEPVEEIGAAELKRRLDAGEPLEIIDVREPHEWAICRIEGARLVPLGSLAERLHELDSARTYVLQCRSGVRSAKALGLLRAAGFRRLLNLRGGILAWAREVDPTMPTY